MGKRKQSKTAHRRVRVVHPKTSAEIQQQSALYFDYALILALAAMIWCVNAVWLKLDSRPPVWDMAMHQSYALNYLPSAGLPSDAGSFWTRSGIYPPFVHVLIAFLYLIFRPGPQVAAFVNLPATILLLWAVYSLGSDLAGPKAGRWACLLTALTPYLFWMSRETILDYWLSAWVAAGLVILRRSDGFRKRNYSILLGFLLAFGLLTKWLFAGFLFFPVLYVLVGRRVWRNSRRLLNFGMTLLISSFLSGIWYFPNLTILMRYFPENARIGEIEGEPAVLSFQSLIYYVRLLEGYQLFALLFMVLAIALVMTCKKGLIRDARFLGVAVGGAWVVVTLIRTKDPRFTMPLLGLLSVIPGAWIQSWVQAWPSTAAKVLLAGVLSFQAYMINFGISWLPQEVILAEGYQGSLRWDWNLYLQHYFHILGPPRRENWRQAEILSKMNQDATQTGLRRAMALVPDLPRFSATNFQLYARLLGIRCQVGRLILTPDGIYPLDTVDYVVTTEGDQGMSWTTTTSRELSRMVEESPVFQLVERFPLPKGDSAHLYRVRNERKVMGR